MTRIDFLLTEFAHETDVARKHLERLPAHQFAWRPHARSFTAGELASHIVDCIRWVEPIFSANELDMDARGYTPFVATTGAALLDAFDAEVTGAKQSMANTSDTQ